MVCLTNLRWLTGFFDQVSERKDSAAFDALISITAKQAMRIWNTRTDVVDQNAQLEESWQDSIPRSRSNYS
ncbi:hypothetical protein QQZ08_001772 [Neonectria magnoliae]|uniref:Uncharacterized protein n=1 Tax=Neonectria magnoliae TaxID=2732573 RepID=A0ABR1IEY3_9HYPO